MKSPMESQLRAGPRTPWSVVLEKETATGEAGLKERIKSCGTMSPFREQL